MNNRYGHALMLLFWATPALATPELWRLPNTVLVEPLRSEDRARAGRTTPLADRLFEDRDTVLRSARRRSYQFDLGAISLGVEALRLQGIDRLAGRNDTGAPRKSWAIGAGPTWSMGAGDQLSLGIAAGSYRSPPTGVVTDPRDSTSLRRLDLNWARGENWRFGLAWQQDGGSTHGQADRMVAIANGAPLHEQGMQLSIGFLPGGRSDPHQSSFGFEVRRASLSSADLAVIGPAPSLDAQGKAYFRTQF